MGACASIGSPYMAHVSSFKEYKLGNDDSPKARRNEAARREDQSEGVYDDENGERKRVRGSPKTFEAMNKMFEKMGNLEVLFVGSNYRFNMPQLPEGLGDYCPEIKTITINQGNQFAKKGREQNFLTTLPDSVGNLAYLEQLIADRYFNGLQALPANIGLCTNLRVLFIGIPASSKYVNSGGNGISDLPSSIFDLKNLEKLVIESLMLFNLSGNINRLTKLQHLRFDAPIQVFPMATWDLTNLERLELVGGEFQDLPDAIGQLEKLEVLDLSYSKKLKKLPASVASSPKLRGLNLERCDKLTFPPLEGVPDDGFPVLEELRFPVDPTLTSPEQLQGLEERVKAGLPPAVMKRLEERYKASEGFTDLFTERNSLYDGRKE